MIKLSSRGLPCAVNEISIPGFVPSDLWQRSAEFGDQPIPPMHPALKGRIGSSQRCALNLGRRDNVLQPLDLGVFVLDQLQVIDLVIQLFASFSWSLITLCWQHTCRAPG